MKYFLAYDLGTGGAKASIFNEKGVSISECFISYDTYYPQNGYHEQKPIHWWHAIVEATRKLLINHDKIKSDIIAMAVSGHSLGAVPIDENGNLLAEYVPIWSDGRAKEQAARFFESVDQAEWYLTTGNGFPPPLYSIFKQMWYKDNMPELYNKAYKFIGTKDFINYKLTGIVCTDYSYASGSGVYDLLKWSYKDEYIKASNVSKDKFPDIFPSTKIIGTLNESSAEKLGLKTNVKVACGGVDNACMALGAGCVRDGMAYTSLGSSAWLTVSGHKPITDIKNRPYVFTHCVPGMFVSATSIFSAGSSFRWLRDTICKNIDDGQNPYDVMANLAADSPLGSKKLFFNPSLGGGTYLDKSINIKGGFVGLQLEHTQQDMIRATLEGVCLNLKIALDVLAGYITLSDDMLIVGGGGKNQFWRKLFADIYDKNIIETNICEDAGSLGAFAIAAVGSGVWDDFGHISSIYKIKNKIIPDKANVAAYKKILPVFKRIGDMLSEAGDIIKDLDY